MTRVLWVLPLRFFRRWPVLHRALHRRPTEACVVCRWVWFGLLREPGFRESLNAGLADIAAGRTVRYRVEDVQ